MLQVRHRYLHLFFVILYTHFISLLNLQIPNSHETADSPVDAIPKNDKLIDWSQVSQMHISTLLISIVNSQFECNAVTVFYIFFFFLKKNCILHILTGIILCIRTFSENQHFWPFQDSLMRKLTPLLFLMYTHHLLSFSIFYFVDVSVFF